MWLHPIPANHADQEGNDNDGETEPVKRFSGIEPFRDEMNHGDDATALVENEITMQDDLGGSPWVFQAEQGLHLRREKRRTHRDSEKNSRAEPDRSIDDSNKA